MHLDLSPFLSQLRPGLDVVVKASSDLPFVALRHDVDVYSVAPESLLARIAQCALARDIDIQFKRLNKSHAHYDLFQSSKLLCRFDVYSDMPKYSRFRVKDWVFWWLVSSGSQSSEPQGLNATFPRPSKPGEALVRYFEYQEFFWGLHTKDRHLEWLEENLSDDELLVVTEIAHAAMIPSRSLASLTSFAQKKPSFFRFGFRQFLKQSPLGPLLMRLRNGRFGIRR